jgi:predicted O-methyltransferase YrrM
MRLIKENLINCSPTNFLVLIILKYTGNVMKLLNLFKYISNPAKGYGRVRKFVIHKKILRNYNYEFLEGEQTLKFKALNLDYEKSKFCLSELYNINPDLQVEMTSCHHNLFAALSQNYNFKDILEIGTHSGAGAALLANLFPNSMIDTVDLHDDHEYVDSGSYGLNEHNKRKKFFLKRNELLKSCKNVTFKQMDSTGLTFLDKRYDFIWVDGNHEFPYVAVDIANSLRFLKSGGLIACDDVRSGNHTMKTLEQFSNAGFIEFVLIHKRTSLPSNLDLVGKYIAVAKLKTKL